MADLRKRGSTYEEIADRLNLSYRTVLIYLKREGGLVEKLKRKMGLKS